MKNAPSLDERHCPACAEFIKKKAILCKYCHSEISREISSVDRASRLLYTQSDFTKPKLKSNRTKKIVIILTITAILILGILLLSWLLPFTQTEQSSITTNSSLSKPRTDSEEETIIVDQTVPQELSVHIDKIIRTSHSYINGRNEQSPAGSNFVLVKYSMSNKGTEPATTSAWIHLFGITTKADHYDSPVYKFTPIYDSGSGAGTFQPGFELTNLVAVFEITYEHLKKPLCLFVLPIGHKIPFCFKNAQQSNSNLVSEQEPLSKDNILEPSADSTSLLNIEDIPVSTDNINKSIDQLLETKEIDDNCLNKTISELSALPSPTIGDGIEADRINKIGLKFLKDKNYDDARKYFALASKTDPSDAKYLSNLGFAEMKQGELDLAKQHLYSSIAISPMRSVAWGDLGETLARQGEQAKAVACFLIGYKVSQGDTLGYLKSLKDDDNLAVCDAGNLALSKLGQ